jgi:hypothetical protein
MITILSDFPSSILAISVTGTLTAEDYRKTLAPTLAERIKPHEPIKLFVYMGPDFAGMNAAAMWEDAKLGISHWSDWGDAAIVTDVGWIADATRVFAPFFRSRMRHFPNVEYVAARAWIMAGDVKAA